VAAYAWGADYHDIFPPRLRALVAFIEAQVQHPISNRIYTDTGPVLERDLAQRAGLGWIGKNTCLIHPRHGSYFLLGEILLGIDLQPDQPFETDHCGTCTRCIDACPTQCILLDRTLDARRCISYLTIEVKGEIASDLRPQTGEWVFGCDICQQVCPWNLRFATADGDPELAPRSGQSRPDLASELLLTPQAFNFKFRGSPVQRAHRRGYLRNVATALGNTGNGDSIPALAAVLADEPEPLVRLHAAWALGELGGVLELQAALRSETDEAVLREIHLALSELA
jgi:epoxyqueuosine reductase